jgi:23S rRNA (uracil1939-C5)-methyltransferase
MPHGARLTLVPERLVAGGDALARGPDGKVVFVEGGLPGETVDVELRQRRRDFDRGEVVRVVEPSVDRVEPPCPHVARGCGGCGWQHLALGAQRRARVEIVREALARLGGLADAHVEQGRVGDAGTGRTTLRLGIDGRGQLGYRARRSHDVVAVDSCLVAHPRLVELVGSVRLPGADEVTLRCSVATGERIVWWRSARPVTPAGLPRDVAVGADRVLHEEVAGVRLQVSATSFFQPSPQAAGVLVDAVTDALGPVGSGHTFVDAYGGVGLFGATVGAAAGRVVLVEEHPSSVSDALVNLAGREVVPSRVEEWEPVGLPEGEHLVVVADPARSGLGSAAAHVLAGLGADRLVLVSCDAAALGRDAALLSRLGYGHSRSVVLDQFPHTHHVEVVTRFDRGRSSPAVQQR